MARRSSIRLNIRSADIASEFGLKWATDLFGAEAIASLPVRKTGKNKGCPKGFVIWRKAAESGYSYEAGGVFKAEQLVDAWIGESSLTSRGNACHGFWLGMSQPLAAGACAQAFFERGRARWAAERERDQRERAEMLAEDKAEYAARTQAKGLQ